MSNTAKDWKSTRKLLNELMGRESYSLADIARALGDPLCTCGHAHSDHNERGCQWGDNRERCLCTMYDQMPDDSPALPTDLTRK